MKLQDENITDQGIEWKTLILQVMFSALLVCQLSE